MYTAVHYSINWFFCKPANVCVIWKEDSCFLLFCNQTEETNTLISLGAIQLLFHAAQVV